MISDWCCGSATRGSNVDFNNNSRAVQGGCGFASDAFRGATACSATAPANPNIYDHGVTQGASDALDAQTLWVQTVRAPIVPQPTDTAALRPGDGRYSKTVVRRATVGRNGRRVRCSTRTTRLLNTDPNAAIPGIPRDPGLSFSGAGGQLISYTVNGVTLRDPSTTLVPSLRLIHWKFAVQGLYLPQGHRRLVSLDLMRHLNSAHATMPRISITVLLKPSDEVGVFSPCIFCQRLLARPSRPALRPLSRRC